MFNFIFEGKIGEILAPVVPSNQLFLAIQHHRNNEIQTLMSTNSYDVNEKLLILEGGYGAIHVACRYNNKFALELILSKGISVDFSDQSGNSPLHYGAKYGNLDICKILIKNGASLLKRNKVQQSAYDVAEGHDNVRQYLLPLLFQAERSIQDSSPNDQPNFAGGSIYPSATQQLPQLAAPSFAPYSQPVPSQMQPIAPGGLVVAPPYAQQTTNIARPAIDPSRVIQPDGFHSSASDPELQAKYGHIKEVTNIAPPPTSIVYQPPPGGAPSFVPTNIGSIYNRYVPYDAHTNSAASIPTISSYNTMNSNSTLPPSAATTAIFTPGLPRPSVGTSLPVPYPSIALPAADNHHQNTNDSLPSPPIIGYSGNSTPQGNKSPPPNNNSLLGNKTLPNAHDFLQSAPVALPDRPRPAPIVSVFHPSSESSTTITASASSSSIL